MSLTWVSKNQLNSYGNLLFMRPPKTALYKQIISGTPDEVFRKKYSYVVDYPSTLSIRIYPGVICTAISPTGTWYNISFVWDTDLTLYAASTQAEFFNRYPSCILWTPVQLPDGFWVAYPPSLVLMNDYFVDD